MAVGTVSLALDDAWTLACSRMLDRCHDLVVDIEYVLPVCDQARNAITVRPTSEIGLRVFKVCRCSKSPLVVLDDRDNRQLVDRCKVDRLVKHALGGRSLAVI